MLHRAVPLVVLLASATALADEGMWTYDSFPAARVPDLIAAYRAEQSITRALARCGVPDYTRKSTRVTARLPTAEDARALRLPRSRPVLVAENLNIDQEGRPIEISIARLAAERVQLVFEP